MNENEKSEAALDQGPTSLDGLVTAIQEVKSILLGMERLMIKMNENLSRIQ